ncbi:MAG TPA: ankyrin repeat domain-containing protein [Luteitalea sp.]|nr:ankyrin repeat domain-containing protein [Luteitalea sp.]
MSSPGGAQADLAEAVRAGNVVRVAALLDAAPERIRDQTDAGRGLLSLAVRAGHLDVLLLLLERGADPTWPDEDAPRGRALHDAARAGRRDMVDALLAHGADPNVHVNASGNAVYAAAPFPEIRALLEARGGTLDPYDLVWLDEDDEVLRRVTADPASADAGCGGVYTAVVTRGKRALLMRLLDAGIRVPAAPSGCRSYLLEDLEMLQLLLARAGLDPDYVDDTGSTLLHSLALSGEADAVRVRGCAEALLAAGADRDARNADGLTPADLARRHNTTHLLPLLTGGRAE